MMVESTHFCLEGRIKELEAETREMRVYELAKDRIIAQLRGRIAELEAQISSLKAGRFIDGNDKPF
jgi:BMFP domain-containing protein YqiC